MNDPYDLNRFVEAQADSYDTALKELHAGKKRTHWIWYVFPQMKGLGHSSTAQHYGIDSLEEAQAYLQHAMLGLRLIEATKAAIAAPAQSLHDLLGSPDDLKFRSSMTLFFFAAEGTEHASIFEQALNQWCGGQLDDKTVNGLKKAA